MTIPLWSFIVLVIFALVGFSLWVFIVVGFVLNLDRHLRTQRLMGDRLQHAVDKVSARHQDREGQ